MSDPDTEDPGSGKHTAIKDITVTRDKLVNLNVGHSRQEFYIHVKLPDFEILSFAMREFPCS